MNREDVQFEVYIALGKIATILVVAAGLVYIGYVFGQWNPQQLACITEGFS